MTTLRIAFRGPEDIGGRSWKGPWGHRMGSLGLAFNHWSGAPGNTGHRDMRILGWLTGGGCGH